MSIPFIKLPIAVPMSYNGGTRLDGIDEVRI